jgi:hypothetical protein
MAAGGTLQTPRGRLDHRLGRRFRRLELSRHGRRFRATPSLGAVRHRGPQFRRALRGAGPGAHLRGQQPRGALRDSQDHPFLRQADQHRAAQDARDVRRVAYGRKLHGHRAGLQVRLPEEGLGRPRASGRRHDRLVPPPSGRLRHRRRKLGTGRRRPVRAGRRKRPSQRGRRGAQRHGGGHGGGGGDGVRPQDPAVSSEDGGARRVFRKPSGWEKRG